jgi:hypothetical protein
MIDFTVLLADDDTDTFLPDSKVTALSRAVARRMIDAQIKAGKLPAGTVIVAIIND